MDDLWPLLVADYEYGKRLGPEERDRLMRGPLMAKDKPVQTTDFERADWHDAVYPVKMIKSEEIHNKFFRSEPWTDDRGNNRPADDEVEKTQYKLTFEVLDGEKKGDWLWAFAPHRFGVKTDGTVWGLRAKIAKAIDPEWDVEEGIESDNSDLLERGLLAVVTPKADPQYAKVVAWLPMAPEDSAKHAAATPKAEADVEASEDTDEQSEWRKVVEAYQKNKTRAKVMDELGDPKSGPKAFEAYCQLAAEDRERILEIALGTVPDEFDEIPF